MDVKIKDEKTGQQEICRFYIIFAYRTYIILLFLISTILLFSCKPEKKESKAQFEIIELGDTNSLGEKAGLWIETDQSGDTLTTRTYKDGSLHGLTILYDKGIIQEKRNYVMDTMHGYRVTYYPNGQIKSEGKMNKGFQDNTWRMYYENGQLIHESTMKENRPIGKLKNFHPNGNVEMTGDYSGNGIFEGYDSLGSLIWKMQFKDNEPIDTLFMNDTLYLKYVNVEPE